MKKMFQIVMALIILFITACSNSNSTNVESPTSTIAAIPTNTFAPTPTETPIPFSLSGNFAFAEEDKIHVYSVDGIKIQTIQALGWVSKYQFSQQGKTVAYSVINKLAEDKYYHSYGLKTNNLENNKKFIVVSDNERVLYFNWDEENDRIIYMTLEGVYSSNYDGGDKQTVVEFPDGIFESYLPISETFFTEFLFSPDKRYLLIKRSVLPNDDIFLIDLFSRTIVGFPKNFNCVEKFAWVPDGKHFLCGIQIFDIENLSDPKLFDSSLLIWSEDKDSSIIVKGFRTPYYKQILAGNLLGDNPTLLYTSKYFIPTSRESISLSPDGNLIIFQEVYPSLNIEAIKSRVTHTSILNIEDLTVKNLFIEEGSEVDDRLLWFKDSQFALLQHGTYSWVKIEQGRYSQSPINVGLYLISLNNLNETPNTLIPMHSGYSSYILDNDYDYNNNNGYIAFMALNSSDPDKADRFSVFIFNEINSTLKEIVKTKGPQSYSVQWIE